MYLQSGTMFAWVLQLFFSLGQMEINAYQSLLLALSLASVTQFFYRVVQCQRVSATLAYQKLVSRHLSSVSYSETMLIELARVPSLPECRDGASLL